MTGTTDRDYLKGNVNLPHPEHNPMPAASNVPVQYLVTISASMDGFPIRIFEDEQAALNWIKDNPPFPTDSDLNCPDVKTAARVYDASVGGIYGYELFTLVGGRPVQRRLYWWAEMSNSFPGWTVPDGWKINAYNQIEERDYR